MMDFGKTTVSEAPVEVPQEPAVAADPTADLFSSDELSDATPDQIDNLRKVMDAES